MYICTYVCLYCSSPRLFVFSCSVFTGRTVSTTNIKLFLGPVSDCPTWVVSVWLHAGTAVCVLSLLYMHCMYSVYCTNHCSASVLSPHLINCKLVHLLLLCCVSTCSCHTPVFHHTQDSNTEAKLSDISTAVSVPLQRDCSCSLSVQRRTFSCLGTADSQTVVFLAELSYTALPAVDVSSLLTSWVASTPPITVASTQLQVDTTCPVVIDSLEPQGCAPTTAAPPSVTPSPDGTATLTFYILIALGVAFIISQLFMVVALAVICHRLRRLNQKL